MQAPDTTTLDARNTFLTREDLFTRHGWERSRGYRHVRELLADPTFPRPIGDRWRLDHIQAWEDHQALAGLRAVQQVQAAGELVAVATEQPVKRRPGRPKRAAA